MFFLLFGYSCNERIWLEDCYYDFVTCRPSEEELPGEEIPPGYFGNSFLWIGLNKPLGVFVAEVMKRLGGSSLGDKNFPGETHLSSLLRSKE